MSVKTRIKLKRDTTANWNAALGFIPLAGEVIIYTDGCQIEKDGETITYPMVKIGDGLAYVQDLPFLDDDTRDALLMHINDALSHVSARDRQFWNHKVDIDDLYESLNEELEDETLIFSRDFL